MLLPTVPFFGSNITRLIVGGNPISGNSHIDNAASEEMCDYFTAENVKKLFFRCEECGINTMQLRGDKHIMRLIREYRAEGGSMKWIAQTASELRSFEGNINQIRNAGADAIYLHGTIVDSYYKENNLTEITERLKIMRDSGKPVGLASHMPEVIEQAQEKNWDIDFFMTCVYNISKVRRESSEITGKANSGEPFDYEDRALMYETIRKTPKPCLAFKIFGAGRTCTTREQAKASVKEAFDNIKPTDAVIIGMFPKYSDQAEENSRYVREVLCGE